MSNPKVTPTEQQAAQESRPQEDALVAKVEAYKDFVFTLASNLTMLKLATCGIQYRSIEEVPRNIVAIANAIESLEVWTVQQQRALNEPPSAEGETFHWAVVGFSQNEKNVSAIGAPRRDDCARGIRAGD